MLRGASSARRYRRRAIRALKITSDKSGSSSISCRKETGEIRWTCPGLADTEQQRARFHLLRRSVGLQPRPLLIAERRERLIAVVGHQLSRLRAARTVAFRARRMAGSWYSARGGSLSARRGG